VLGKVFHLRFLEQHNMKYFFDTFFLIIQMKIYKRQNFDLTNSCNFILDILLPKIFLFYARYEGLNTICRKDDHKDTFLKSVI